LLRRWILLISAGWLPHFICPSRGLPRSDMERPVNYKVMTSGHGA
jgi:hypothetical protein